MPEPRIVFRDEWLAVIEKPPGLVVHPAPGHHGATLVSVLGEMLGGGEPERPGIVHRLDRDTSGLMIVARQERSHAELSKAIHDHLVRPRVPGSARGPPAIAQGHDRRPAGPRLQARRQAHRRRPRRTRGADPFRGRSSRFGTRSLVRARLETGRTHQIRAHFKAIGHPVGGDASTARAGASGSSASSCIARRSGSIIRSPASAWSSPRSCRADLQAALELRSRGLLTSAGARLLLHWAASSNRPLAAIAKRPCPVGSPAAP